MRMKILWSALMAIAFASCTQEDVLNNGTGLNTLRASMEQGETKSRVGFTDGNAEFFWTKGDKIGVTTTSSQTFQEMILVSDFGKATGTFSGTFDETSGYAVYPYREQDSHSVNNGVLTYTLTLPDEYTYTTLDTDYAKADGNSHNAPMWGSISDGSVFFKHLGGVIAFRVDNLPENTEDMEFVLTATNQISGSFSATLTENEPKIVSATTSEAANKQVTITFSTAVGQTSGYFYVPVPTGSLGDLSVVIYNDTEEKAKGEWKNININRKDIKRATISYDGEIKQVASMSEVNDALTTTTKENLIVKVSGEVTVAENTIEIPADLETETTTFSFASVADDAKITIQDENGGNYDGKIIIEIPEGETISEVVANIPNGEVYIKQGTVTTLVSTAADNTTIIGAKAEIGTLIVVKGNVRIEEGGEVTEIERATENTETVYVVCEGATAPTVDSGDGVELMTVGEYEFQKAIDSNATSYQIPDVATFKRFRDAVNNGTSFTNCTVELTETIDLNNEEWTPIGTFDNSFSGNFDGNNKTIKNLKITEVTPDEDGYVYIGLFGVTDNNCIENLNIENVNISSNGHIVAAAIAYPYYTTVENITVKGDIKIKGGDYTAGVLAYTRLCVNAKNLVITANPGSEIIGNKTVGGVISDIQMNGGLTANYSNFKASGLEITGVDCVGGISGIISSQTLDGATVENVSIICDAARKGIVSGALGSTSTIKNISVTNVTGADKVVGATYTGAFEVIADGDIYKKAETTE